VEILEFTCFVDFVQFKKNDDNSIKKGAKKQKSGRSGCCMVCGNT